ncbi:MAG: hypothetical protein KF729_22490 [Sandaracinaceae bacterium]|nr:hypothetical protein [Sandaracinaceae bacterium]
MTVGRGAALATALLAAGCFDQHVEPRTWVADGAVVTGDAFTGSSPSTCFPRGADTLVIGPDPGCVEASIEAGPFEGGSPSAGRAVRFVDATGGLLDVTLDLRMRCEPSREGSWEVTWLVDACDRGLLTGGGCVEEWSSRVTVEFDAMSEGGVLEALVAGDRAVAHFSACAVSP